jgi:tetratricopeptide (TPR) repeat protein
LATRGRRTARGLRALLAALAVVGAARDGRADDARAVARAHYARGLALGSQNGYEGALEEFNAAYAISPQFEVLYNIGQTHVALGHIAEAIETLSRYLQDGGDRVSPLRRAQVVAQIALLRTRLPSSEVHAAEAAAEEPDASVSPRAGTLTVRCPEPGLKIMLDGKRVDPAESARGVAVPAGSHHLALSSPGRRTSEQGIEVPAGAAAIVICQNLLPARTLDRPSLTLEGPPVFSDRPAIALAPASATLPLVRASTVGYVLGGAGVALGTAALGVYLWNRGQYHDAQSESAYLAKNSGAPDFYDRAVQYDEHVDAIHQVSVLTAGLAVASAGLIAGGFYLLWRSHRHVAKTGHLDEQRSWAALSSGGVSWMGQW